MYGSSTGGFAACGIFARQAKLGSLVCVNGSGALLASELCFRTRDGRPPMADAEQRVLSIYDPINFYNVIAPRPVLLQHGQADIIIPIEPQQSFFDTLRDNHRNYQENLVFQSIPRLNHHISISMLEEAVSWFNLHLLRS